MSNLFDNPGFDAPVERALVTERRGRVVAELAAIAGLVASTIVAAIVVTNYLHRPLFPQIAAALDEGGLLIYETFMVGNERYGRPTNPEFLLQPGELREAFAGLTVLAFKEGEVSRPKQAVVQRIVTRR